MATQTKAKARLKDIVVAESSLVDRPANDHPFVLTKAADGAPEATSAEAAAPATTEAKEDMAVAPDVKQQLADTLSAVIEEVNGFAQAVGEIPVAEGAPTPPVFIESLASIGGKLTALAESLRGAAAPAAPAAEMEDAAPAAPADPSADEKLAALVERAVENALARHMKPAEAAKSEEPAEATKEAAPAPAPAPTTKSDSSADLTLLRDEMRQVKLLAQAALAKATLGSLAGGGQAPNAQPAATPPAESAPIAWPDDISAALPAQPAR